VTASGGPSLARVTVVAPKQRIDVALPDTMIVAELLPHLLGHAGEALGDSPERPGGWALRRTTGTVLEPQHNLATQGVRDGELLHLAPARADWPEPAYDDVVDVIASGSRRAQRAWSPAATRACGLAVTAVALLTALTGPALAGPAWTVPAITASAVAVVLLFTGVLLARAFGDAVAGAIVGGCALPWAFAAGAWLSTPANAGFHEAGGPGLLLGSALLTVAAVLGHIGVAALPRLFTAGITVGVSGLFTALLHLAGLSPAGSVAVTLTVAIGMLPSYPMVASRLGRVPFPELPSRVEDIVKDRPVPRRTDVFAAVARASEVLTGLLLGTAVISVGALVFLVATDHTAPSVLLVVTTVAALLLRARLLPALQQRIPLLVAGVTGAAALAVGAAARSGVAAGLLLLGGMLVVGAVALIAGLRFSRRAPAPYLGRAGDILDIVAIMALIPLACAVIGIFSAIRGMFGSIGG
jgi:ESX secretion system protein EccD